MWRWHEQMWGHGPGRHGWMMEAHPHGWTWMHGRSGSGFQHHAWMMDGSGNGWWPSGKALMIALMAILVVAVVVGSLWAARRRPAAPHAS